DFQFFLRSIQVVQGRQMEEMLHRAPQHGDILIGNPQIGLGQIAHYAHHPRRLDLPLLTQLIQSRQGSFANQQINRRPPLQQLGYKETPNEASTARDEVAHIRSEEHTSELQSRENLVCRLLLEKK